MSDESSDQFGDPSSSRAGGVDFEVSGLGSYLAGGGLEFEPRAQEEWRRLTQDIAPEIAAGSHTRTLAEYGPVQRSFYDALSANVLSSDRILEDGGLGSPLRRATTGTAAEHAASEFRRERFIDRTEREIVEASRRFADLALGDGKGDRIVAPLERAERDAVGSIGHSGRLTGVAVGDALRETYALLGSTASRDRVLGYVTGVGSLAPIAGGMGEAGGSIVLRTQAMFLETQNRLLHGERLGTIDGALRAGYGDLFPAMRRPRTSEIEAVLAEGRYLEALKPHPLSAAEVRARVEAMSVPWVRKDLPDASVAAMARLTEIDRLVARCDPAAPYVVDALRRRLGDYREAPEPEPETLDDPVARTGYQLQRGLDPLLTVLPTAVLVTMFAPLGIAVGEVASDPDQLENAVRMMLKRLEHALRRFLVAKLTELYGEAWFDALPSDIRGAWRRGRQRAIDAGRRPDELIAYADIDHYRRIIEHPERWERLFEPVFRDQSAIRETLRRIAVIRNDGAHFRVVTAEDLIVLRAEGIHLATWLGIRLGD